MILNNRIREVTRHYSKLKGLTNFLDAFHKKIIILPQLFLQLYFTMYKILKGKILTPYL